MALAPGTRLGVYEIIAPIGEGGMGQVFRARDTKLDRDIAIKILPEAFAHDAERLARFTREAKTLASLNHPHIAAIYGLEESGGVSALVMELVEGEDLAQRIARAAIPIDEALLLAKQIAEALEAAHDAGIIHRDLKPANIKLRPDGTVKVLDFGLAKALEPAAVSSSASQSPTITTPAMTQAGIILGTAAYMSPEQAKGRAADKRSDVWAFGCVLFEMLTAKRAFEGEDVSDTLAAVLRGEPDWSALPVHLPHTIAILLRRCLERDRRRRIPDTSTALFLLEQPDAIVQPVPAIAAPTVRASRFKLITVVVLLAIAAGAAGALVSWRLRPETHQPVVSRFLLTLPEGDVFTNTGAPVVAIAPDASKIVYVARRQLYLRAASALEPRPIPGTDSNPRAPVFSPTGESIVFVSVMDRTLKRVAISGGVPVTVSPPLPVAPLGLSWTGDFIYFGDEAGISRLPATGGTPELVIATEPNQVAHGPQLLPDGDHVLFTLLTAPRSQGNAMGQFWISPVGALSPDRWDKAQIVVHSIKTGERKTLLEGGSDARYLPTGHLVYAVGGVLLAVRFDANNLQVIGGATPVIEGVRRTDQGTSGTAHFDVSHTGVLVYVPGPISLSAGRRSIGFVDRKGAVEFLKLPLGAYNEPRISADGKQLAFVTDDDRETNVWVYDLAGTSSMRRLTLVGRNRHPVWSPDGQHVAFQSDREGDLAVFRQRTDGSGVAERLTKPEQDTAHAPESWSPDGKNLLVGVAKGTEFWAELLTLDNRTLRPLVGARSTRRLNATFSPDGKWVAYTVMTRSQRERSTFVQPFPPTGAVYQLTNAGHHPFWSRDGRQLYYIPTGVQLAVITVSTRPTFSFSEPTVLSRGTPTFLEGGPQNARQNDAAHDGRVVGVFAAASATDRQQIQVVLNWFEELNARVPRR